MMPGRIKKSEKYLKKIVKLCDGMTVLIGHPLKYSGKLYNAVSIIKNKEIKGCFIKSNLPNDGIHYEKRWFEPWRLGEIKEHIFDKKKVPNGTIQYEFSDSLTLGFEICRDSWDSERPAKYIRTKNAFKSLQIEFAKKLNPSVQPFVKIISSEE